MIHYYKRTVADGARHDMSEAVPVPDDSRAFSGNTEPGALICSQTQGRSWAWR
jgi:hypothetical protein